MDPKRQNELDYLARQIASEHAWQAAQREQADAMAARAEHENRVAAERNHREKSQLSREQRSQHDDLERAVDEAIAAKSQADSATWKAASAARSFRRRAWVPAWIAVPFLALQILLNTIGPGGADPITWLVFLGVLLSTVPGLIGRHRDKHFAEAGAAKMRFEAARLRDRATRLHARAQFNKTSRLQDKAARLQLS